MGKAWARISRMSPHELFTRVEQELRKRLDILAYRSGFRHFSCPVVSRPVAPGRFFFTLPQRQERVELLRRHLPDAVEKIIVQADKACRHHFDLLGYKDVDYGPSIDWHRDAVHDRRAPLKPWYQIPFLDFSIVGDHKVIWELSRHQHLVTLAKAFCLTQDPRYAAALRAQWYDWQQANPYPLGINWGSSLEVAFRSLSWLWVQRLLDDSPEFTVEFRHDLRAGLARNAWYVERYLSTYFSPNTHLLGEALALFFIGTLVPELAPARRWREKGWTILVQETQRQVRSDGLYFEQALYYHVYALDFFLHARLLASLNQVPVPLEFDRVAQSMLEILSALSQPGSPQPFGDDDGGRLFDPIRNRAEHLTDPLATGAVIYARQDLAENARLTEESVWLLGPAAVAMLDRPASRSHPRSRGFAASGIYVFHDASDGLRQQMTVDAGPQGIGRSGHGHADALSVRYSFRGRPWLVDPGTGCYISGTNERDLLKGTGGHNTLRVDGLDQAVPTGPFSWSSLPNVKVERWIAGEDFSFFAGSHDGYARLADPVLHRRFIFHLHGRFWLVRDVAEGTQAHTLESFWHFAPDLHVKENQDGLVAISPPSGSEASDQNMASLVLMPAQNCGWAGSVGAGPVSAAYGVVENGPVACFSASVALPAELAVLLRPLLQVASPGRFEELEHKTGDVARGYRYQAAASVGYAFFAGSGKDWSWGPWSSDARFLFCLLEDRRLVQVILVAGSFARYLGQPIVTLRRRVEHFEWLNATGRGETASSDQDALEYLLQGDLECADSVL